MMFYKVVVVLSFFYINAAEAQRVNTPFLYQENKLWGIKKNKYITAAVYDTLIPIKNTTCFVARKQSLGATPNSIGVIANTGKMIIPFNYMYITTIGDNYLVSKWKNGQILYGLVSHSNDIILDVEFLMIQPINTSWVAKSVFGELYLYDNKGNSMMQLLFENVLPSDNPAFLYSFNDNKVGLIDDTGREIFPPIYKSIEYRNNNWETTPFSQWQIISKNDTTTILADTLQIWDKNTTIIGINNKSHIVHNIERVSKYYSEIIIVSPSIAITKKSILFGAVSKKGKEILPPIYDYIHYKGGFFYIKEQKEDQYTIYDSLGKKISILKYDSIGNINEGFFPVKRKGKWGFMNKFGEESIQCSYDRKAIFKNGKAIVSFYGEVGVINLKGEWVVKPRYTEIVDCSLNLYIYKINNRYYLKNYTNKLIYFSLNELVFEGETIYEIRPNGKYKITSFGVRGKRKKLNSDESESWKIIKVENRYGFTDANGVLKITYRYDSLLPFSEELAAFKLRNKWGFIDIHEQIIIQPFFSKVSLFRNKVSIIRKDNKMGLINPLGKYILKPEYELVSLLRDSLWLAIGNNLSGVFNSKGDIIIQKKYNNIKYINDDIIIVNKNKQYGIFNRSGVSILPRIYDYIDYDIKNKLLVIKKKS